MSIDGSPFTRILIKLVEAERGGPTTEDECLEIEVAVQKGVEHTFERLGVVFFLSRESGSPFYAIRPRGSPADMKRWLREQSALRERPT